MSWLESVEARFIAALSSVAAIIVAFWNIRRHLQVRLVSRRLFQLSCREALPQADAAAVHHPHPDHCAGVRAAVVAEPDLPRHRDLVQHDPRRLREASHALRALARVVLSWSHVAPLRDLCCARRALMRLSGLLRSSGLCAILLTSVLCRSVQLRYLLFPCLNS